MLKARLTNMKKLAFISLLGIVTLLSACSSSNIRVKQPKFEEEGSQVSYSDFTSNLEKAAEKSDLNGEGLLESKELKTSIQSKSTTSVTRLNKKVSAINEGENMKSTGKYDPKNLVCITKTETTNVIESENEITKYSDVSTVKSEGGFAITTIDNTPTSVSFNNNTMIMTVSGTYDSENAAKEFFDSNFKMQTYINGLLPFYNRLPSVEPSAEDTTYKFFKSGNVFTYIYSGSSTEELSDGDVYASMKTIDYVKAQIIYSTHEVTTKIYYLYESATTYSENYMDYRKNDVENFKGETSFEFSVKNKKLSVSKLDVTKYQVLA